MANERQTNNLHEPVAVKMIRQQISLTNRLTHQSITLTDKRRQCRTRAEHCRLRSGPPLTKGLDIQKNSPVSVTKLTLGLGLGFISSHMSVDTVFLGKPRAITGPAKMSLLLEAKCMPELTIKPRLILATHMDELAWLAHNVQPAGTDVRSNPQQDCQQAKCYARTDHVLHHRLYSS